MITHEDDGVWVTLEETIANHHEDIFACLTTPGGLMSWFCISAEIDLRTGGLIVFGWDQDMTRTSTLAILSYDAGGRIAWDWLVGSDNTHAPVYWTVEPKLDKGSRIVLRQGPFSDDVESLLMMVEEAQTWRWHLCNMRTVLEAKHDMRKVRPL